MADTVLAAPDPDGTLTITVAEVAARYLQHSQQRRRSDGTVTKTHISDQSALRYLAPWYRLPASKFGLRELIAVRRHMIETAGRTIKKTVLEDGKPVEQSGRLPPARGYINDAVNRIRAAFRWAANHGLIDALVVHSLSVLQPLAKGSAEGARETRKVRPVPDDVFFATLPHLPKMAADILRLLRCCGARPGEICNLRPREIDKTDENRSGAWMIWPTTHKTENDDQERFVALNAVAQNILAPYLAGCAPDDFVFTGVAASAMHFESRRQGRRTPLTPSARARRAKTKRAKAVTSYTVSALGHAIARATKRAGIRHWTPHQVRHATLQEVRNEFEADAAQAVAGHADPQSTQRYARPSTKRAARAVTKIGKKHARQLLTGSGIRIKPSIA